ncbi:hypothetical protein MJT46_007764 [Ovis ammon polii x Ovis aries]|uniref:Ig-like domain-containing protein n=1 Tax=Ovis aries TaxID=9940 RepID=A0A836A0F9_SHEEP|nr:hypothetical protein JEQ12_017955 [Ovis aries]KAI4567966.1 hypothetical protein MJT46_007764 [Ovis ammon polii x Ovis aries]
MKTVSEAAWDMIFRQFPGGLRAQSVTQPEDEVPVAEGDPVTVKCTYSVSGSPYLSCLVQAQTQQQNLDPGSWFTVEYEADDKSDHAPDLGRFLGIYVRSERNKDIRHYRALVYPWEEEIRPATSVHVFLGFLRIIILKKCPETQVRSTLSLAKTSQPIIIDSYEGQEVNIPCNHTTIAISEYIFWYRQFPNQGPQFIIQGYTTTVENEVASLLIPPDRKFSTLSLPRTASCETHTATDGAAPGQKDLQNSIPQLLHCSVMSLVPITVLITLLALNKSRGEKVEQYPSFQSVQEGDNCVINCTYTDSASAYFVWYKQEPGKGLQLLIHTLSNVDKKEGQGLIVLLNKKNKHLSLNITATHPGDSATYFCAARAQWSPGTCSLYPNLSPKLFFFATEIVRYLLYYCILDI